jgi:hypothetical protein
MKIMEYVLTLPTHFRLVAQISRRHLDQCMHSAKFGLSYYMVGNFPQLEEQLRAMAQDKFVPDDKSSLRRQGRPSQHRPAFKHEPSSF